MAGKKIGEYSVGIKYEVDRKSLDDLQNSLASLQAQAFNAKGSSEMTKNLKEVGQMAEQISLILEQSFNKDLGTLNMTKFTQSL